MGKMKVWFDEEGDFLEIGFGKKKGHFRDIGNDVWERVEGGIINFEFQEEDRAENSCYRPPSGHPAGVSKGLIPQAAAMPTVTCSRNVFLPLNDA